MDSKIRIFEINIGSLNNNSKALAYPLYYENEDGEIFLYSYIAYFGDHFIYISHNIKSESEIEEYKILFGGFDTVLRKIADFLKDECKWKEISSLPKSLAVKHIEKIENFLKTRGGVIGDI